MLTAVTRNLANRWSAIQWLEESTSSQPRADLVFLQEVNRSVFSKNLERYVLVRGQPTVSGAIGCTSALVLAADLGEITQPVENRPFPALGTYAAIARLRRGGQEVWLISAHTSPSRVAPTKRREDFGTRSCERVPWWSDAFLADLRMFAAEQKIGVVIAGDFNQALAYDSDHKPHHCSREFLEAVRSSGYVDITSRDWNGVERATRRNPDYQLDRVFASRDIAAHVRVDARELVFDEVSDHAAVWFSVDI